MESPRKFNDCYFYYYSTCTKGDSCVFRHEPSALGCETMCTAWQQGKCLDKKCKLRHMELRKNRKQIPCYWENQPGGCRKKHCPFMHKNPEARTDGIAPSQAIPANIAAPVPVGGPESAPVPHLYQQVRSVVLDSAILGVVPGAGVGVGVGVNLTGLPAGIPHPHPHSHPHPHTPVLAEASRRPEPYAMPVDPLVVSFEEESDNESTPSSTPVKTPPDDPPTEPEQKSQELMLLEKIQAEAAAFYNYSDLPIEQKERKLVRANLNNKYDRLSLDELAGKRSADKTSLDFKVLSLEEIRAKKRSSIDITAGKPITLNLNRKRKTSETVIESGNNKIIKLVRSNSIVYKKVDKNAAPAAPVKTDNRVTEVESRKRTISDECDILELQDDDLYDDCFSTKKLKTNYPVTASKPKLIRSKSSGNDEKTDSTNITETQLDDSDSEVQVVRDELTDPVTTDIIELDDRNDTEVVDLSDDEVDIVISDYELGLGKNVPDVVASCKVRGNEGDSEDVLNEINEILDDDL